MTADQYLPPDPPEPSRTAWETEHLDDPADDAGTYVEITLPPVVDYDADDWRALAEGYRREKELWRERADYYREQMDRCEDALADLRATFGIGH